MFGVMSLAIACGEEIVLTAEGPDEEKALAALERVLEEMREDERIRFGVSQRQKVSPSARPGFFHILM
jgi:hypothetical protein